MCVLSSSRAASLVSAKYANPTNCRSPGAHLCTPGTLMLAMNVGYTIRPICWAPPAAGTDTARPLEHEIFKSCIAALGSATEPRIMGQHTVFCPLPACSPVYIQDCSICAQMCTVFCPASVLRCALCFVQSQPALRSTFRTAASVLKQRAIK